MSKGKNAHIRNSTAEFLVFSLQAGESGIEVRIEDETVWLTQKLMATLVEVDVRTVNEHIGNIYRDAEQSRRATIRKFRIVQTTPTAHSPPAPAANTRSVSRLSGPGHAPPHAGHSSRSCPRRLPHSGQRTTGV